ncbi:hypothetical protein PENSPDRAFT_160142 [Peniophora sp. CONT]|nr:hypothetical protein PENSPDRAFT_160142 [Peniophora sp. CONT]
MFTDASDALIKPVGDNFWAIVVGINCYDDGPTLSGCVNDAKLIIEHLIENLLVPPSRIIALTSSPLDVSLERKIGSSRRPTRVAILDALHAHFRDNDAVDPNDNLFFSFSGFGSIYGDSEEPSRTKALCPMDRNLDLNSSSYVCDISDRELDIVFSEIRDSKGANITAVLDCSHSPTPSPHERSLPRAYNSADKERMFEVAESDPRRRWTTPSLSSPSWQADKSSHVSLAACESHQAASEVASPYILNEKHGFFTRALVYALQSPPGIDPALTYYGLVKKVMRPSTTQTFVGAGDRLHSRLWFREGEIPEEPDIVREMTRTC